MKDKIIVGLALIVFLGVVSSVSFYKGYQLGEKLNQSANNVAITNSVVEQAEGNNKVVEDRKQVKHENQNRDRDALIRLHCQRGWVLEPSQCKAYNETNKADGKVRGDIR